MEIVLYQPLIPQNVGAVARTCAALSTRLHLIKPFPFEISERRVRRAGLDYWHLVDLDVWDSWQHYWEQNSTKRHWVVDIPGDTSLYEAELKFDDVFIFGQETKGVGQEVRSQIGRSIFIPILPNTVRSLNLSNCVAVVSFEVVRRYGIESFNQITAKPWFSEWKR